ncbi:hypothetical protein QFC22_002263 [Naganishia vaughanmartiniae]|uniref:Uncharacterized protein n=1 Tax=Naganishia vaughanmartiniae TaxID=1424756 RepID=A0ACC2XC73_9TREE|nr:hypothetical protein QFC22_002263 [Naganishia vaughanmartiniae]
MLDGISGSLSSLDGGDSSSTPSYAAVQIMVVQFLIHLSLGTIHHAQTLLQEIKNDTQVSEVVKRVLSGLIGICQGRSLGIERSTSTEEEGSKRLDMVVANNEAVALLANGDLSEAVARLGVAMQKHDPDCYAEPYIFNLATLYELDGGSALQNKVKVLDNAVRASGEVIKVSDDMPLRDV